MSKEPSEPPSKPIESSQYDLFTGLLDSAPRPRKKKGRRRKTIEDVQEIAEKRGWKFLSEEYRGSRFKHRWECENGHEVEMLLDNFRIGIGCPACGRWQSQEQCRQIFEHIFKTPFRKFWPVWLVNSDGNRMEFDGYSKKLKLAFEYQGQQHYEITYFADTQEKLNANRRRDAEKIDIAKQNGVTVVPVRYFEQRWTNAEKINHVVLTLRNRDVPVPAHDPEITFRSVPINENRKSKFPDEDIEELEDYIATSYNAVGLRKARAILPIVNGQQSVKDAATSANVPEQTIYKWLQKFSEKGAKALARKKSERLALLTPTNKEIIIQISQSNPQDYGYTKWSHKRISLAFNKKTGQKIAQQYVSKVLKDYV